MSNEVISQKNDCLQELSAEEAWFHFLYENNQSIRYGDTSIHYFDDTTGIHAKYPDYTLLSIKRCVCEKRLFIYRESASDILISNHVQPSQIEKKPFIRIKGNIYYDMYYRSYIDTPYMQHDIYQHTVTTYLDVTVKDKYPLRVGFTTRFSNASLFRNFTGLNFQFNSQQFKNELLEKAKVWGMQQLVKKSQLDSIRNVLESMTKKLTALRNNLITTSELQKIVEAKERELIKNKFGSNSDTVSQVFGLINNTSGIMNTDPKAFAAAEALRMGTAFIKRKTDSTSQQERIDTSLIKHIDSTANILAQKIEKKLTKVDSLQMAYAIKKQQADSLENGIRQLEATYQKARQLYSSDLKGNLNKLSQIKNNKALMMKLDSLDVPDSILPKGYKTLLAIKSFGIGRTMVNYSELTAKNVSITGIQIEYNPRNYYAFASGAVDYVFRDFVINDNRPKQYLNIIRAGKEIKAGHNVIFTYYFGKKQLYNYIPYSDSTQPAYAPKYQLMGFSLEETFRINQHNTVILEAAKSSLPYYNRTQQKQSLVGSALSFKDRSNEAYSIKLLSFIPLTQTRINGFYKHMGANFQSFSLYSSGSKQNIWMVKVDQPFFKRRLMVTGSVRTNDYSNPYLQTYKSNMVFKSIQATLRIRKWPVISAGYFPSSQLIKYNDALYQENLFYTLVGSMSHFYNYHGIMMNTFLSYTQFYNRQSDSGFVYFNTKNISLSHHIAFPKYSLQTRIARSSNTLYKLYSAEGGMQYKIKNWLSLGGSLKYNRQTFFNISQFGYMLNTNLKIKKLGEFRLHWDKGFIPGGNRQLVENNVGRVTYFKTF